jgi:hypothetical protein
VKNTPNETSNTIAVMLIDALKTFAILNKCIAFFGDNCNTMFGGIRRSEKGKNVFLNLKRL